MIILYYLRRIISIALYTYELCIFVRAVFSWIDPTYSTGFGSFLYKITEPAISPVRKLLRKSEAVRSLPIDFSPVIVILILQVLNFII